MLSQWPPPNKLEDIPKLVQQLADGFLKEAKKSSEFRLASEQHLIEQFAGDECQGNYVTFQMSSGNTNTLQAMFMMSLGGKIWNGQFTGPSDAWKQALTLLKSAKKDG